MNIIRSGEPLATLKNPSLFLCGSHVATWAPEALSTLDALGFRGSVVVSGLDELHSPNTSIEQFQWEHTALNAVQCAVIWNVNGTPALNANFEFGKWHSSGKRFFVGSSEVDRCANYLNWLYTHVTGRSPCASLSSILNEAARSLSQPTPKTFVTADWHLGETRLELMQRSFKSTDEHTQHILERFNAVVSENDTVIMNGDCIALQKDVGAMLKLLPNLARFNGRKTLIRGNHDRALSDEQFAPYFERIVVDGGGIETQVDSEKGAVPLYITHYPTQSVPDRYNLVAHIHSSWKVQKNMLNVGVDVHSFAPMELSRALFFQQAVTEFYDQDVWVAEHPANQAHANRGKPGRYLDVKGIVGGTPAPAGSK